LRKSFSRKRRNSRAEVFGQILCSKNRWSDFKSICLVRRLQKPTFDRVREISRLFEHVYRTIAEPGLSRLWGSFSSASIFTCNDIGHFDRGIALPPIVCVSWWSFPA
jgi:hypothetical protein